MHRKFGKETVDFFDKKMLAELFYNTFLAEHYYEHWSFIRDFYKSYAVERVGEFVEMLVEIGDISIPFWYKMLDNQIAIRPNCMSTIGCARYNAEISEYWYHYNDYAAFYLSQITKIPLPFHRNYEERVKEIIAFKTKIKIYCVLNGISLG